MFALKFNTENAAFEDDGVYEVDRVVKTVLSQIIHQQMREGYVHDANGNRIGDWYLTLLQEEG